jgi:MFS family permease
MFKSHWGSILTGCMLFHAITFALAGATPNYVFLLVISLFIAVPGSLWHLPAAAAISQRFPDRRGFAVTMHGFGANIGNFLAPLITGGVLGLVTWRPTFFIFAAPYAIAALLVWWSLKNLGKSGEDEAKQKQLGGQFKDSARLLRNPLVMGLFGAAMLRSIGLSTVNNWTPFFLTEPIEDGGLAMGSFEAGVYLSLLTGVGILSTPILGLLSDRYGRKAVLVPGFAAAAVLSMMVVSAGDSSRWMLGLVLASMGIFTFGLHQIIQASVLDVVGRGTEAKAIGLMFGLSGMLGVATPFIASLIIDNLGGYGSIYYYAGILTAVTGLLIVVIPFKQNPVASSPGH